MKSSRVDMDSPRLGRTIIAYAIPLIFINVISGLFNSVDMIMLDAFDTSEGSLAVAAVGATTAIVHLVVNTFFGISTGTKIVLAHQLGAGHKIQVRRTISTAVITAATLGLIIGVGGFALSGALLNITKCPADCFEGAKSYLRVYMLGAPAIMIYNFASAILTAGGDTKRPLYYMVVSGLSNVLLNFILLLVLDQKVLAVAIATAVSQCIGAALAMARLMRSRDICHFDIRHMRFSLSSFKKIMINGLPIAFSSGLLPFSNLQIQTQLNELGSAVVAGTAASSNIEAIVAALGNSTFSATASVFVGYNLGARRTDRVKKSILYCLGFGVGITLAASLAAFIFAEPLASLYVSGEASIRAARVRMITNVLFYFLACGFNTLGNVIQAFGYSYISTVNSVVSVLLFRIFWMLTVYPPHRNLDAPFESLFWITSCWPVSWTLLLITNICVTLYLYFGRLKKGKLKKLG